MHPPEAAGEADSSSPPAPPRSRRRSDTGLCHAEPGENLARQLEASVATSTSPPTARVALPVSPRQASRTISTTAAASSGSSQSLRGV